MADELSMKAVAKVFQFATYESSDARDVAQDRSFSVWRDHSHEPHERSGAQTSGRCGTSRTTPRSRRRNRMKIVQFKDGTFGVRQRAQLFCYEFLDANLSWNAKSYSFCRFPSREQAESYRAWRKRHDTERGEIMKKLRDTGKPV